MNSHRSSLRFVLALAAALMYSACATTTNTASGAGAADKGERAKMEVKVTIESVSASQLQRYAEQLPTPELQKEYSERLTQLNIGARPQALPAFLLVALGSLITEKVVPKVAETIIGEAQKLWPEKIDAYALSDSGNEVFMDNPFWQLTEEDAGEGTIQHRVTLLNAGYVVSARVSEGNMSYDRFILVFGVRSSGADPRILQVVPLARYAELSPKQMKLASRKEGGSTGELAAEVNIKLTTYSYTATGAVRETPVITFSVVDSVKLDFTEDEVKAGTRKGGWMVLKESDTDKRIFGSPGFEVTAFPVYRVPDVASVAAGAAAPGGAEHKTAAGKPTPQGQELLGGKPTLYCDPYSVNAMISFRTEGFLKSSKGRDWYLGFLEKLKGTLTEEGKKLVNEQLGAAPPAGK